MNQIQQVNSYPNQTQTVVLPDGTSFNITLYYVDLQQGWFISNLTYGAFVLSGWRVFASPNMLHQFRNQIPFGLACYMTEPREPMLQTDFTNNIAQLFLLSMAEVEQFTAFLTTG